MTIRKLNKSLAYIQGVKRKFLKEFIKKQRRLLLKNFYLLLECGPGELSLKNNVIELWNFSKCH